MRVTKAFVDIRAAHHKVLRLNKSAQTWTQTSTFLTKHIPLSQTFSAFVKLRVFSCLVYFQFQNNNLTLAALQKEDDRAKAGSESQLYYLDGCPGRFP